MICGSGGSKSRLAKAAGEPSGEMRDKQLHAVVARSTCWSQTVQNTPFPEHFWKLRCRKSARRCGEKHISKSKCTKHLSFGALLGIELSKKVYAVVARSTFRSQNGKKQHMFGPLLDVQMSFCVAGAKVKSVGRRGAFEEDLRRCISRGRRSTRDMFFGDVRRSGRWFPERGCILEHEIFRFAKIILRDRCNTSYDLASLFRGRCSTLDRWNGKSQNALVRGRQLCTQLSNFEESIAELLRCWCCQLRKLRKSRRIVSSLALSSSKIEEASHNCCVFDVVEFKNWGNLGE